MSYKKYSIVFIGIAVAVIFWFIETLAHSLIFDKSSFSHHLIPHDLNELWMRSLIFLSIIVFGIYANLQLLKIEKINKDKEKIQKRLEEILTKTLSGFITICANCKKIQKEDSNPEILQSWQQIESYISNNSEVQFSHDICPECGLKLYGEIL